MNQHKFFVVSLVLLVFNQLVSADADEQRKEVVVSDLKLGVHAPLAVDLVSEKGIEIKFPYFGGDKFELEPEHAKIAKEDATEMLEYFRKVIASRVGVKRNFVSRWSSNVFGTLTVLKNLSNMGNKQYYRQVEYLQRLAINDPYVDATGPLFMFAINESKKALVVDDNQQALREDADNLLDAMIQAIQTSPVAHYLDYARGTVNGEPFVDVLAMHIARLRQSGCATVIGAMDMIIRWSCGLPEKDSSELEQD